MPAILTCAVGDIHGSYTKLRSLLRHCMRYCGESACRFVFLGDYIDRGRQSRDVVEFLIQIQASSPHLIACLKGNHEDTAVFAAETGDAGLWLDNGGDATLASYGVGSAAEIPAEHLDWFARLPLASADERRFFVHAGVMPGVPLREQSSDDLIWIREPFLSDPRDHGLYVVHGHTPLTSGRPDLRRNRLNLDTGACFGGPLTAAVFDDTQVGPRAFITDDGAVLAAPAVAALEER